DVRGADRNAQPLHLVDPGIGDVLGAPVSPDAEAAGHVLADRAERMANALTDWLQGRPPVPELGGMPAHDLVQVVGDRPEEPPTTVGFRITRRRIRALHLVRPARDGRPVVRRVAVGWPDLTGRQQPMLRISRSTRLRPIASPPAHQPRTDLAIPLAVER